MIRRIKPKFVSRYVRACLERYPEEDEFRAWCLAWLEGNRDHARTYDLCKHIEKEHTKPSEIVEGYRQGCTKAVTARALLLLACGVWFDPSDLVRLRKEFRGIVAELDAALFGKSSVVGSELQ